MAAMRRANISESEGEVNQWTMADGQWPVGAKLEVDSNFTRG